MSKIGLLLICTGKYDVFLKPLLESADKYFMNGEDVTYFLFSDKEFEHPKLQVTKIGHTPWPGPTLFRYHTFLKIEEELSKMDYLFYCDIDMLFVDCVDNTILSDRIATIHPGFKGGRGTPEYRQNSTAFVGSNEHMVYYAGGFNGGSSSEFLKMCKHISNNINIDLRNGVVAIWHDESHMNRYFIDNNPTNVLDPGYCYPDYPPPYIIPYQKKLLALVKNHDELRKIEKYDLKNPSDKKCQIKNLEEIYLKYFGYKTTGTFVEVGGFDGISWSNTYGLAVIGWRGLVFEPQKTYYEECVSNYRTYLNVNIINSCVGNYKGDIELYTGYSLATTKLDVLKDYSDIDWFKGILDENRKETCKIDTLNNMLIEHNISNDFDLLVIDVEGAEYEVLEGINLEVWKPKMIIIELHEDNKYDILKKNNTKILNILNQYYNKIYKDDNNSIFIKK